MPQPTEAEWAALATHAAELEAELTRIRPIVEAARQVVAAQNELWTSQRHTLHDGWLYVENMKWALHNLAGVIVTHAAESGVR